MHTSLVISVITKMTTGSTMKPIDLALDYDYGQHRPRVMLNGTRVVYDLDKSPKDLIQQDAMHTMRGTP
jgi:hypothetical protein